MTGSIPSGLTLEQKKNDAAKFKLQNNPLHSSATNKTEKTLTYVL